MNKNDSGVVFSRVGQRARCLDEIRNIEGDEHPALLSRHPKQLIIVEGLQRSIAECGNCVMSTLPKPDSHRRRHVSVKQDSVWHLRGCHFQPRQLFPQLFWSLVIQLEKGGKLLRIRVSVCSGNLGCHRGELRKVLTKFFHSPVVLQ